MSTNVSALQHGQPDPMDNIGAPKSLNIKKEFQVFDKQRAEKSGAQVQVIQHPKDARELCQNYRASLNGV